MGTDKDADALVRLFIHLGFYTNRYDDLTGKDMRQRLRVSELCITGTCIVESS